jgi:hypothetical protein
MRGDTVQGKNRTVGHLSWEGRLDGRKADLMNSGERYSLDSEGSSTVLLHLSEAQSTKHHHDASTRYAPV